MTKLYLYNTMSRQKEELKPLNPGRVTMYACGMTVYNYIHVGNARMSVVFDTLYRVLKQLYPNATPFFSDCKLLLDLKP